MISPIRQKAEIIWSGNVILTGGDLAWEPVTITVSCNGKIRYTANASPFEEDRISLRNTLRLPANPG
jgi:hypothetical protein